MSFAASEGNNVARRSFGGLSKKWGNLPRPNVVRWPTQTPAVFSRPLPPTTLADAHPPPHEIPSTAAVLYQLGSPVTVTHSSRPKYIPPAHSIAEAVRSTAPDARLQTTFSRPLPNTECLCQHRMGFGLRGSSHLSKCHVLCWYDGIPCATCSNQSGFPQWWTRKSFHQLPPQEQAGCPERQQICFLMGPLDMRGLVGAATIIGCFKYGASVCGQDDQDDPVFLIWIKDEDLLEAPDDAAFLQSLRHSCARVSGVYPPLALVEAYITEEDSAPRVRRLHLIIVDLHRRRRMASRVLRLLADLHVDRCAGECLNTLPIPWKPNQEAYQLRYVFGYAIEGSDLPC